jgi:flagellar biosynthesis GTPase FlhF
MKKSGMKLTGLRILIILQSLIILGLSVLIVKNWKSSEDTGKQGSAASLLVSMVYGDLSKQDAYTGSSCHVAGRVTEKADQSMTDLAQQKDEARLAEEEKARQEEEARAAEEKKKEEEARKAAEAQAKEEAEAKAAAEKKAREEAEKKAKEEAEARKREARQKEEEARKGYILPDSDSRYYSVQELEKLDDDTLQMAINELYAKHGRKFDTESIRQYFEKKTWYKGTIDPKDFDGKEKYFFNDYEMENRKRMVQIRDQRTKKKQ